MRTNPPRTLLICGVLAVALAGLSILDMFLPKPYDGVVLEADTPGRLLVREVVPDSGAALAGIQHGDQIVGIDRDLLRTTTHAAKLLNQREIGETVPYLIRRGGQVREVPIQLGTRRIGSPSYVFACLLGFAFYFIGLFVLRRQPQLRAAQIFFLLGILFLLFLVCRLRPASYSWIDNLVLTTGTVALLFLPAAFLHFFFMFPKPIRLRPASEAIDFHLKNRLWLSTLVGIYAMPPLVLGLSVAAARTTGEPLSLISGAPAANWFVLALYMLVGLTVFAYNSRSLTNRVQRRGASLVFFGSLFGLLPFLVTAVAFPSVLHTKEFFYYGLLPLALVPLTFAYAIVRFQLLNIRVILRRSLLYTGTTAAVTAVYALGIAFFNRVSSGTGLIASPFFPWFLALSIVLLFEPLRRRLQVVVDRFFFRERKRLISAMRETGEAFTARVDVQDVVQELVDSLPKLLSVHFAALYLDRGERLERVAGPDSLPESLLSIPELHQYIHRRRGLTLLEQLQPLALESAEIAGWSEQLERAGVELVADLATPRRSIGTVLLSGKVGQIAFDREELDLLRTLLHQAAVGLENSMLVSEYTEQAELESELKIAASVQQDLLPGQLQFGPQWRVAALCQPARHVGGDFFTQLPGPVEGTHALVYGDVAGKSVSGALVMMAAHEALHSLAMTHSDPEELFGLANKRLYRPGQRKNFVALAYLTSSTDGRGLDYLLAGQPQPLLRRASGEVSELKLPENRLPLGAMNNGRYRLSHAPMGAGDLLLGYSDGVVEAQSPTGEFFGLERLTQVVADGPTEPESVIQSVVGMIEDFTRGTEPYDDLTLVAITRDREELPCESST